MRHAVQQLAGWYFHQSIQGYKFLQTGELPPSVVRDRLKITVARLRARHQRAAGLAAIKQSFRNISHWGE
ncbi:MAG: hypothetical protein IPP40_09395 [bacterium]|nr:hypothetical protein [bacterium]